MACLCTVGVGNTGVPGCAPIYGVPKKFILTPTYDDSGVKNSLDLTVTMDAAWLTTQLNAASDVRLYPLPDFENVVSERGESTFEEAGSGRKVFIKEGVRTLTGEIWGRQALPQLAGKIKNNRCVDVSAYLVDNEGNIMGQGDASNPDILYPIPLDSSSIDAIFDFSTDSTKQKLKVTVSWADSVKDEELYMIEDTTDFTFDALNASGLLDIEVAYSSISTTGFVANLFNRYSLKKASVDTGLIITDFALYNNTTAAAVVITSVTESPDGTYTFVIPAQTSADVMVLTPTKNGRDYTSVIASTILVP